MEDNTRAAPRLMTVAAIALVTLAFAAFAWMSGSDVAGAASTSGGGSDTSGQLQRIQEQDGQAAPEGAAPDRDRDGHPCPEGQGGSGSGSDSGSGSSGQQDAPSTATPDTAL